jgi:hypothetical protein
MQQIAADCCTRRFVVDFIVRFLSRNTGRIYSLDIFLEREPCEESKSLETSRFIARSLARSKVPAGNFDRVAVRSRPSMLSRRGNVKPR